MRLIRFASILLLLSTTLGYSSQPSSSFAAFASKMQAAGLGEAAINAFRANYEKLVSGEDGMLPESAIEAISTLPTYEQVCAFQPYHSKERAKELFSQTVVLKLNGGLGTSMGLEKAKSLLRVKGNETFLSLMTKQILFLRNAHQSNVRFVLMNSFSTSADTFAALKDMGFESFAAEIDLELMQNQSPKVDAVTLQPASYPENPENEWCPPGHGDLYAALLGSGMLDRLIDDGIFYMFVSNSDNLGAILDLSLLNYFANSGKTFMMEVAERSEADKKGGHLAFKKGTCEYVLRESAMCPKEDVAEFQNIAKHKFFNTNNIWLDLRAVREVMQNHNGTMPLPLIKNKKTVDPRNPNSAAVFQLETAMGAAIGMFKATAIVVPRSRFAPVKTTADLFVLRSDAYILTSDFQIVSTTGNTPVVALDERYYKLIDQFDALVKDPPSLVSCSKLTVNGPALFERKPGGPLCRCEGTVQINVSGNTPMQVPQTLLTNGTNLNLVQAE